MHSNISDGTDTPEELLENVKSSGIKVFSITDHDSFKSAIIMKRLLRKGDPLFISGIEFSCRDNEGKYHILGYGFNPESKSMKELTEYGQSLRIKKLKIRLDFLKKEFGFSFPNKEIETLFTLDNPGKPHIGNLMVKCGFADTKEDAINNYLNRLHLENDYLTPDRAISGIIAGGGIPVLAHPFYGGGDELIIGDNIENRLKSLIKYGLKGIEAFYSGFSQKLRNDALSLADRYNLFVTAGSDYHGANKLVKIGDTGLLDETEYPYGLRLFLANFN